MSGLNSRNYLSVKWDDTLRPNWLTDKTIEADIGTFGF